MKENKIQSECFQWFHNNYCTKLKEPKYVMFSVPNEIAGNNKIGMMQAKAMGLLAGVSDTIIILKNKVLFCEFKDAKGKQSDKQLDFQSNVEKLGFEYKLIRSFEDFKNWINTHICP